MPAPVTIIPVIVAASITAVVTGYVFHRYVFEPIIAPHLERMAEDFLAGRRARRLAAPVEAAPEPSGEDRNDIPLNERRTRTRRRRRTSTSTSDSGDEESAPLLGAQGSTTAREEFIVNENVSPLRRRVAPVAPGIGNTVYEVPAPPLGTRSSTIARDEPGVNGNASFPPALPRRAPALNRSTSNNGPSYSELQATSPTQVYRLRQEPTVLVPPSPATTGVSRSDVQEWRTTVARNVYEEHRRQGQGQPIRPVADRRFQSVSSPAPHVPLVPTTVVPHPPLHVFDEPNPQSLPQTPIYPTHVITDSSVPSTPSTTSGGRDIMFTPPPQLSPLRNSTITMNTNASNNGASSGANQSEISVLDPWNGVVSPHANQGQSTAASLHSDRNSNSTSSSQLLASPPRPPQIPPFSPLSSLHASAHSAQAVRSPRAPTLQSPPPQTPNTPPYLLTPSAQHPHHVHQPAPPNIAAVASSPITPATATTARFRPPISPPPTTSPVSSFSQSHPNVLDQDQGIEIVSPLRSPTLSDPYDLVAPGSPGPFGSPGSQQGSTRASTLSPQSPFIPLSIPPLPISPPLPPSAVGHRSGLGSAGSMNTTTVHQPSSANPPLVSSSTSPSMFYSFTGDSSTTSHHTSPRPHPPTVQSGGILSFPPQVQRNNHNQQQQFSPPAITSPMLSELEFVSEFGGSELGSNDDIGSESSWSSARF